MKDQVGRGHGFFNEGDVTDIALVYFDLIFNVGDISGRTGGHVVEDRDLVALSEERITEVQKFLLNGYSRQYIHDYCKKTWGVETRQADSYIQKATETIREINSVDREDNLANITTNLWELFRNAKNNGDVDLARKILMDIGKLRGLDEQTIKHVVDERPLKDVPTEVILQELERLKASERH